MVQKKKQETNLCEFPLNCNKACINILGLKNQFVPHCWHCHHQISFFQIRLKMIIKLFCNQMFFFLYCFAIPCVFFSKILSTNISMSLTQRLYTTNTLYLSSKSLNEFSTRRDMSLISEMVLKTNFSSSSELGFISKSSDLPLNNKNSRHGSWI